MSKHILQSTTTECGLACIATISNHFGTNYGLSELRDRFVISARGVKLEDLIVIASNLHMSARPLKLDLDEISALQVPCILHWDLDHFVVLLRVGRAGIRIHDPALGEREIKWKTVGVHFTGIALELSPSDKFRRQEPRLPIGIKQLIGKVTGLRRSMLQLVILAAALQFFGLISPFVLQWIIDHAVVSGDSNLLWVLIAGMLLLMLIQQVVSAGRSIAGIALSNQLNLQWSSRVMQHLMKLPMAWFERRHAGDILSRFQSLRAIQGTITSGFVEVLLDGIFAAAAVAIMFMYSTELTGVVLVSVIIYAVVRMLSYGPLSQASADYLILDAKEQSYFLESLRGAQSIKLAGLEDKRSAHWSNFLVSAANRRVATEKMQVGFRFAYGIIFGLESAIVVGWGAWIVIESFSTIATKVVSPIMTVGMLIAFLSYKDQFSGRMQNFVDRVIELFMLRLQIERLADIVLAQQEHTSGLLPIGAMPPEEDSDLSKGLSIQLIGIGFRYGERTPWIFRNLNLSINSLEHVAIVGPSGCGKSTLAKILLGLLKPVEGKILINGVELEKLGIGNWRSRLGSVMQDDQLFSGNLRDNISGFADQVEMDQIEAAARKAGIHDEICDMPMGYYTPQGEMGSNLSGGQKQRVLLARALYRLPQVLILDEATSHLDVRREVLVSKGIAELKITRVVIAHRPETIAMADRVVELGKAA